MKGLSLGNVISGQLIINIHCLIHYFFSDLFIFAKHSGLTHNPRPWNIAKYTAGYNILGECSGSPKIPERRIVRKGLWNLVSSLNVNFVPASSTSIGVHADVGKNRYMATFIKFAYRTWVAWETTLNHIIWRARFSMPLALKTTSRRSQAHSLFGEPCFASTRPGIYEDALLRANDVTCSDATLRSSASVKGVTMFTLVGHVTLNIRVTRAGHRYKDLDRSTRFPVRQMAVFDTRSYIASGFGCRANCCGRITTEIRLDMFNDGNMGDDWRSRLRWG